MASRSRVAVAGLGLVLASCSGDSPAEPPLPVATSIVLSGAAVPLTYIGATHQLSAAVMDQNGAPMAGAVSWESSAAGVATVSASGLVTAVSTGAALVTAKAGSASASAAVTVQQVAAVVAVSPAGVSLTALGATAQLTATVRDEGGTVDPGAAVSWTSSAPDVASVTGAGLVTALRSGGATITATSGPASAGVPIVVQQTAATVRVAPASTSAQVGEGRSFQAQILDARDNPMGGGVAWSTSNAAVASVDTAGLARAVSPGTATIRATAGSLVGEAVLAVTDTVRPKASIVDPAGGATLSEVVTVRADASDNHAVTALVLLVDGRPVDTLEARPWEFRWRTRSVANGAHALRVTAVDASGNVSTSESVSVATANGVVVRVINYLPTRIYVAMEGQEGWVPCTGYRDFPILPGPATSLNLGWEAEKPTTAVGDVPLGERAAGVFDPVAPTPADSMIVYPVDHRLGDRVYYFALVSNATSGRLLPVIDLASPTEYRCPCYVPAGQVGGMLGYYQLRAWSSVALYDYAKGYTGAYLFVPITEADISYPSGRVSVTATAAPGPPRAETPGQEEAEPGAAEDHALEVPLLTYDEAGAAWPVALGGRRPGIGPVASAPKGTQPRLPLRGIVPPRR